MMVTSKKNDHFFDEEMSNFSRSPIKASSKKNDTKSDKNTPKKKWSKTGPLDGIATIGDFILE